MKVFVVLYNFKVFHSVCEGNLITMKNPHIIIEKKNRLLQIYDGAEIVKECRIALGFATVGDKNIEGDGKTPEGEFYIFTKNDQSKFHLSLGLSYPNRQAAERGLQENIIQREEYEEIIQAIEDELKPPQKTALGGEIYIHGGGTGKRLDARLRCTRK